MKLRIWLAAALGIISLGLAAPSQGFDIPEGDSSEALLLEGTEPGAPAASSDASSMLPPRVRDARIQRAWNMPAASLENRVVRTRRESVNVGVWSADAAGRAALRSPDGDPLERAQAAVALAPDLPAAHMALARGRWLHGDDPIAAAWSVADALTAALRHPEGAVWLLGSALFVAVLCCIGAGLVTVIWSGLAALFHVAHDLGHVVAPAAPEFARVAVVCGLLLVPLMLGEGIFGLALGMLAIGVLWGSGRSRLVLASTLLLMGVAAFPMAEFTGRALAFFARDTTAAAAYAVAGGSASPLEVARLQAHEETDDLALWALALDARQRGSVGQADAYYQRLLERRGDIAAVANNAANVRLDLDHMESAFALYGQALEHSESAVVLFNLSQAYGQAFQVDDLNRTLAHAQSVDGDVVARLTALEGTKTEGFVADLPLTASMLWPRLLASRHGSAIAEEIRGPLAPGRLGSDATVYAGAFGLVWVVFALLGTRYESARGCQRCGTRVCPRCDPANIESELCTACTRLFFEPEKTDRALRAERMAALQKRQRRIDRLVAAAAVVVPGAAGLLARRPATLFAGAFCAALALVSLLWRDGVVPDPYLLGPVVPVFFLGLALVGLAGHAGFVASALTARRKERA